MGSPWWYPRPLSGGDGNARGKLQQLRTVADLHARDFASEGFRALFAVLQRELDDEYFALIRQHLRQLKFTPPVLIQRTPRRRQQGHRLRSAPAEPAEGQLVPAHVCLRSAWLYLPLHQRDEGGARTLSELQGRGINLVANALGQSVEHIVAFFNMLRIELSFYIGCLNLCAALVQRGAPFCFPIPAPAADRQHKASGLAECLPGAHPLDGHVVGNDLQGDGTNLVIITGANQGPKTTFLRRIGLARIMMQCGMFVPAKAFTANVCERTLTHFKREEGTAMESGKLRRRTSPPWMPSPTTSCRTPWYCSISPSPPRTNVKAPRSCDRSSVR